MSRAGDRARAVWVLLGMFVVVAGLAPFFGQETISLADLRGDGSAVNTLIFWKFRVPRVVLGLLAGGTLAVGGCAFQAVFRNPLATPFTLGTASGAALGASLAIRFGWGLGTGWGLVFPPVVMSAFLGALGTLGMVLALGRAVVRRLGGTRSHADLLLAGVAVSFLMASVTTLVQYVSDPTQTARMLRWTMGGLDVGAGVPACGVVGGWSLAGVVCLAALWRTLDLLAMGDDVAATRGVNVARARCVVLLCATLMVAAVVAFCGPIGFVGLLVPHAVRGVVGASHRLRVPASFLAGGVLLTACDTCSRVIFAPVEIPVGILVAFLGAPAFLLFQLRR